MTAIQAILGMVGAPFFGRWSDAGNRRIAVAIVVGSTIGPYLCCLSATPAGLWGYVVLTAVSGPFRAQASGAPVLWAWLTEKLPSERRETGLTVIMASGSLASVCLGVGFSSLRLPPAAALWLALCCLGAAAAALLGSTTPPTVPRSRSVTRSPWELVRRQPGLARLCAVAGLLTMPDVAGMYIGPQVAFQLLGIAGPGHAAAQQQASFYFTMLPNFPLCLLFVVVGLLARYFGPAPVLATVLPLLCLGFATPSLLLVFQSPLACVLTGTGMFAPIVVYPILVALTSERVPPGRLGEALGTIAAFKNLASLIAPLVSGLLTEALADAGRNDLYWIIFPAGALVMLLAWPFALCLSRPSRWVSSGSSRQSGSNILSDAG